MKHNFIHALFLCVGVIGCGEAIPANLQPVKGSVTIRGKPVPNARIFLLSESQLEAKPRFMPSAQTEPDGTFVIGYSHNQLGAPLGKYIVYLYQMEPNDAVLEGMEEFGPPAVPEVYQDAKSSTLRFEVKPGENTLNLEL